MTKRKKFKNVKIIDQELTPTSIGYLDTRQKSPLILIFIFGILLAFLYYLPEITVYINEKYLNTNSSNNLPATKTINKEGVLLAYSSNLEIVSSTFQLTDFQITDSSLKFIIKNVSAGLINLNNYYLELYDLNKNLLQRIDLSAVSLKSSANITINQELIEKDFGYLTYQQISNKDIPNIALTLNEENIEQLVCEKNGSKYIYLFTEQKLDQVNYNLKYDKTEDFTSAYNKYQEKYDSLEDTTYTLNRSIISTGNYFEFAVEIDMSTYDDNLLDENFFTYQTLAKMIYFKMNIQAFKCS